MGRLLINSCRSTVELKTNIIKDGLNTEEKHFAVSVRIDFISSGDFTAFEKLSELDQKMYINCLINENCDNLEIL